MRWLKLTLPLVALSLGTLQAEEAKPSPSPVAADDQALDLPMMTNEPIRELRVPQYGPDGKLQMQFAAEMARKVSDKTLEFENLKIEVAEEKGMVTVDIPKSQFDTETRILTGDKGATIKRQDFVIDGDTVEFHVRTRFSKLGGNVKMIIYSLDSYKDE